MGQVLQGGSVSAGGGISQGVFNVLAGAQINQNDLVELGPNGKCYTVQCTDYAAVSNVNYGTAQTNAATGQIVAQTQVVASQTLAHYRQALLQGADGSIYTFTLYINTTGLLLSKYSSSGALVSQAAVDTAATVYAAHQILSLSNGNIAVAAVTSAGQVYFAIYDASLNAVKSLAALPESGPAGTWFSACTLSGGGFAIVYQQSTNPLLSRLVTYDNAGIAVLAPTTIWTRTGTSGTQYHSMAQISSGNLMIAISSVNTVSSIGLFHGVVTTAGVSVKAFTNIDTASTPSIPAISVMPGYYAIARGNGTDQLAFIFDNAGNLQGSRFSAATTVASGRTLTKLLTDGTAFYLIWPRSSDTNEVLTKLPVTGTGYVTTIITITGQAMYNQPVDAFYENGLIVTVHQSASANTPWLGVINAATMTAFGTAFTAFGVSPGTTNGQYQRVIPSGDFSFICLYDYANTASTNLAIGKYANTAVMGVAQAAAAANALVPVAGIAGGYAANYVKGSPSKQFDHSATNIHGNKGAMLNYGVVLKGF